MAPATSAPETRATPPMATNATITMPTNSVKESAESCPRVRPITAPARPARNDEVALATSLVRATSIPAAAAAALVTADGEEPAAGSTSTDAGDRAPGAAPARRAP